MDLRLTRNAFLQTGVYGTLTRQDTDERIAVTLEHAYVGIDCFIPKLPPGNYVCQRGWHQLEKMKAPFETFEVLDVPGHTNILMHVGNSNCDSSGCILLGCEIKGTMIVQSRVAFDNLMHLQIGCDSFILEVTE